MEDREKVIKGWERCKICDMCVIASPEGRKAYLECEYTTGLYCRKEKLIDDTLKLLKSYHDIVRCKDCKYWLPMNRFVEDYHPGYGDCELNQWVIHEDWFCADGVKQE